MRYAAPLVTVLGVLVAVVACDPVQMQRDKLRYTSVNRGWEAYVVRTPNDSLLAAERANDNALRRHWVHRASEREPTGDLAGVEHLMYGPATPGAAEPFTAANRRGDTEAPTPTAESLTPTADLEWVWSEKLLKAAKDTTETTTDNKQKVTQSHLSPEAISAFSSSASIAQMRDLLTEPAFATMLPLAREVQLGCLPPPDSAAFEAVQKLSAKVDIANKGSGELSGEYASKVAQLFEESERTLFLQYALFRLCEMSVNSPSEFRNVYPVIIHDIVRRTAEMHEWEKTEERKTEEQKTKRAALELQLQQLKATAGEADKATSTTKATAAAKATPTPTSSPTRSSATGATPTPTTTPP